MFQGNDDGARLSLGRPVTSAHVLSGSNKQHSFFPLSRRRRKMDGYS
jgi:hypothetical protein